jgi:hypothetical protein
MGNRAFLEVRVSGRDRLEGLPGYSTAKAAAKADRAASLRRFCISLEKMP